MAKNIDIITINLFNKREVECILHTTFLPEQEIKASCEIELLKAYGSVDAVLEDVTIFEVIGEDRGDVVICVYTRQTEKVRYYGTHGHLYRFKYGISPDVIKSSLGLGEPNIVKVTCKELGITQKELADKLGASEGTVRNWSSSNDLPQWALNFIETLKENKKNKEIADTVKKLIQLSL